MERPVSLSSSKILFHKYYEVILPSNPTVAMSETENTPNNGMMIVENVESVIKSPVETNEPNTQSYSTNPKVDKKDKKWKVEETLVDDGSGKRKPIKPRSWTWDHFSEEVAPRTLAPRARCNWCVMQLMDVIHIKMARVI
ncbi:hypothetical protein SESBI_27219 [Sesbania bispinosa]|nr:hypothetical protein SESBI_27219 [Sesbania bispinosa]